jgi:MoaA/NifB/PqqE/SkfB family radical SAM enzyme
MFSTIKSGLKLGKSIICKQPNYLIFFVTSECNLHCKFCSNWARNETHKHEQELSLIEIYKIAKNFPDLFYLTITGGEPFLRKDLYKIITIFKRTTGVEIINITSNGFFTDIIEQQIHHIFRLNPTLHLNIDISIDEIGKNHDAIRGVIGSFENAIHTLKKLYELKKIYPQLEIRTSTTFSYFNQTEISATMDWIRKNLHISMPTISIIRGIPRDPKSAELDKKKLFSFIKTTTQFMKSKIRSERNPLKILLETIKLVNWEINLNNLLEKHYNFHCVAGKKLLIIDDIGEVFPCEILPDSLGNLRSSHYNLKILTQTNKYKQIIQKIHNSKCNCTFECAIQDSLVNSPKNYYYLFIRILKIKCFDKFA